MKLLKYFLVVTKKCGNNKAAVVEAAGAHCSTVCRQSSRPRSGDLKQLCFLRFTYSNAVTWAEWEKKDLTVKAHILSSLSLSLTVELSKEISDNSYFLYFYKKVTRLLAHFPHYTWLQHLSSNGFHCFSLDAKRVFEFEKMFWLYITHYGVCTGDAISLMLSFFSIFQDTLCTLGEFGKLLYGWWDNEFTDCYLHWSFLWWCFNMRAKQTCIHEAELHVWLIYWRVSCNKELMFASSKGKLNPV